MEWSNLLDWRRLGYDEPYNEQADRPSYIQDYDRILFSAPFRRLANKTQVHPLYENDHLHHRLIHSLETASVGRSLGIGVGAWLEERNEIEKGERHRVAGVVQAACLAHDIGNPPFGHSGEDAIGQWFKYKIAEKKGIFLDLPVEFHEELSNFEGNAQGFRIINQLEMYRNDGGMRLSKSVIASFVKYPVTAEMRGNFINSQEYCGLKKFGIFKSEFKIFEKVFSSIEIPCVSEAGNKYWRRHPLAFLVEAADDICYKILDVEDGFTSGDFSYDQVSDMLLPLAGIEDFCQKYPEQNEGEKIAILRAVAINKSIKSCIDVFKENYDEIIDGRFSLSLIDASSVSGFFRNITDNSNKKLFTSKRKVELEVFGRNVIHGILNGFLPIYEDYINNNCNETSMSSYCRQLKKAVAVDLRDVRDSYSACRSICDYVSGMTDRYAVKVAKMLVVS